MCMYVDNHHHHQHHEHSKTSIAMFRIQITIFMFNYFNADKIQHLETYFPIGKISHWIIKNKIQLNAQTHTISHTQQHTKQYETVGQRQEMNTTHNQSSYIFCLFSLILEYRHSSHCVKEKNAHKPQGVFNKVPKKKKLQSFCVFFFSSSSFIVWSFGPFLLLTHQDNLEKVIFKINYYYWLITHKCNNAQNRTNQIHTDCRR